LLFKAARLVEQGARFVLSVAGVAEAIAAASACPLAARIAIEREGFILKLARSPAIGMLLHRDVERVGE